MDFNQLNEIAVRLLKNRKAHPERERGSIYEHGRRVAELAVMLRREVIPEDASKDEILRLAGMFHDIGKGIEPHAEFGAPIMKQAVKGVVSEEEAAEAARLIAAHCDRRPQDEDHDVWVRLIQDADLLDHIGTYTIWMDIQYAAYTDEGPEQTARRLEKNAEEYAVHCRSILNFPISKEIYDDRIALYLEFTARFADEARGRIHGAERFLKNSQA